MSKVCFAFQKAGHCNRGNKCKFDHVFSTTKSGGGGGKGGPLHAGEGAGAEIAGVIVEESSNKRVCSRSGTDESFVAIEDFDGSLGEGIITLTQSLMLYLSLYNDRAVLYSNTLFLASPSTSCVRAMDLNNDMAFYFTVSF